MAESTFWLLVVLGTLALLIALAWVYRQTVRPAAGREPGPGEPVVILGNLTELNAELYRSKLAAAGIMAFVRSGGWFAPTLWYRPLLGWQVLVRYADRFAAEECLDITLLTSEPPDADEPVEAR